MNIAEPSPMLSVEQDTLNYRPLLLAILAAQIPLSADIITVLSATSIANATSERNAWITGTFGPEATADVTTTFEADKTGRYTSLTTDIGTFSILPNGKSSTGAGTHRNEFTVLNNSTTPFSGRYDTTPSGSNWLDSNDITALQLTTTSESLYFFITDVDDNNGQLKIQTADGTTVLLPRGNKNGSIFFVGIQSSDAIGYVQWLESNQSDGFGLDDFGTAKYNEATVPEPGSLPAALVALLILAAAVRLRAKSAMPPTQNPTTLRELRQRRQSRELQPELTPRDQSPRLPYNSRATS